MGNELRAISRKIKTKNKKFILTYDKLHSRDTNTKKSLTFNPTLIKAHGRVN